MTRYLHRYVAMPKTGSTAVDRWLSERGYPGRMGHATARDVREAHPSAILWGTVRHPGDWYRSWFGHCLRGGGMSNTRVREVWRYLGASEGDPDPWPVVLDGLIECGRMGKPLPFEDHLLNPGGCLGRCSVGMWSATVRHFFCDLGRVGEEEADRWLTEWLIPLDDLHVGMAAIYGEGVRVPRVNAGPMGVGQLPITDRQWERMEERDGPLVREIRRVYGVCLTPGCGGGW